MKGHRNAKHMSDEASSGMHEHMVSFAMLSSTYPSVAADSETDLFFRLSFPSSLPVMAAKGACGL